MTETIIHIGEPSPFVLFLGGLFEEVFPRQNAFILLGHSIPPSFEERFPTSQLTLFSPRVHNAPRVAAAAWGADLLVAHSMNLFSAAAFAFSRATTTRFWSGWGADYYGLNRTGGKLVGEQTAKLLDRESHLAVERRIFRKSLAAITDELAYRAARKADYFSAPIPTDYPVFRDAYPVFNGRYLQLNYGDVTTFGSKLPALEGEKANILAGNSAHPENNHLEMFELLAQHDLSGRKVIVPLTYGRPDYRKSVLNLGHRILGKAFHPLVDHLPLASYLELINSCAIVIMNHRRQQGVGNIGAALLNGSHIYLDPLNPTFSFLRELGADVKSVKDLDLRPLPSGPMSCDRMQVNRSVADSFWGEARVRSNVRELQRIFN